MFIDNIKLIKGQLMSAPIKSFAILSLSMCVGALEAVSVATLVPLFDIIANGSIDDLLKYEFINTLVSILGVTLSIPGILTLFCLFILVKGIFNLLAMTYIGRVVAQISFNMREEFLDGLLESKWSSLAGKNSGEFINAVNLEIPKAASIYRISCTILGSVFIVLSLFIVLFKLSPAMTFGGMIISLMIFVVLSGFVSLASNQSKIQVTVMNSFISRIHELLASLKVIKAMNLARFVFPLMMSEASKIKATEQMQIIAKHGLTYLREPIVVMFMSMGLYYAIEDSKIPSEVLLASLFLFFRLTASVGKLQSDYQTFSVNSHFFNTFQNKLVNLRNNREKWQEVKSRTFKNTIEYRNVTFSHNTEALFENVDFILPTKGFISISGASGSGKTTLIDMLLGFYNPTEGDICVDNRSLMISGSQSLRSQIGYVQQDPFIFNDTVNMNVSLGDGSISSDDVIKALKDANAYDFVSRMPEGLETNLGEVGSKISGGQKQRISIARALARKPRILILDEATSALDRTTMLELLKIFKEISNTKLVIAVTHQQEVLDASDNIYIIENNRLRELA